MKKRNIIYVTLNKAPNSNISEQFSISQKYFGNKIRNNHSPSVLLKKYNPYSEEINGFIKRIKKENPNLNHLFNSFKTLENQFGPLYMELCYANGMWYCVQIENEKIMDGKDIDCIDPIIKGLLPTFEKHKKFNKILFAGHHANSEDISVYNQNNRDYVFIARESLRKKISVNDFFYTDALIPFIKNSTVNEEFVSHLNGQEKLLGIPVAYYDHSSKLKESDFLEGFKIAEGLYELKGDFYLHSSPKFGKFFIEEKKS